MDAGCLFKHNLLKNCAIKSVLIVYVFRCVVEIYGNSTHLSSKTVKDVFLFRIRYALYNTAKILI